MVKIGQPSIGFPEFSRYWKLDAEYRMVSCVALNLWC